MNIKSALESTYLKTAKQAGLSENENYICIEKVIEQAIKKEFRIVMIRPENVIFAKKKVVEANSKLAVGTVIDFPKGNSSLERKLQEAFFAIENGADDLDFVCNYRAFKKGEITLVKQEILECTKFAIANNKNIKWIIEVAALSNHQIIQICALIKNVVLSNFKEENINSIFIKSSTGFYKTKNNMPNGATYNSIILMLENASPLPIKASGGITSFEQAQQMLRLGVKRIGTSAAMTIIKEQSLVLK